MKAHRGAIGPREWEQERAPVRWSLVPKAGQPDLGTGGQNVAGKEATWRKEGLALLPKVKEVRSDPLEKRSERHWTWGKKRWGWARWFKRTVKRLELQFPFFTCRPCQREDVWSLPKPCSWYKVHAYLSGLLLCQREPFRPNLIGNVCLSPLPSGKLSSLIINRRQPFLWKESVRFFVGWL